ncbi:MAG TPA: hypothetical protein VE914_23530 [Candidatus Angelobacter sp.]|nr:hypothetical protein [Candidatus Angelobacter sp.]
MRGEPEVIGPKWTIQLGDLSECHRIEVRCFRCNRVGVLYPDRLRKLRIRQLKRKHRWPPSSDDHWREMVDNVRVAELETLLRCTDCGNRVNNSLRVVKLPPHA